MLTIEETFAQLVQDQLKRLGENAFSVEQKHGLPADAVRSVIREGGKRARPNLSRVQELCEALGLELYIGPPRETGPVNTMAVESAEFASIPLYNAKLAAGIGSENGSEDVIGHLAFRRDWLSRLGVSASNAVLARAQGDSMNPCIHDGDLVLIDRSKTEAPVRARSEQSRRPSPIYALLQDGQARIKRIERPELGLVMLMSDNPAVGPEILTGRKIESLNIIGRVMWWAHTNRE